VAKLGPLPKTLPRTIRESIEVVRRLGKKYLWVDSICINQSNSLEKRAQIAIMDAIYLGAFATIIALDGSSADSGLLRMNRSSKRKPQFFIEYEKLGAGCILAEKFPTLSEQLDNALWTTRG
jgi:hypothetical protein